MQHDQNLTAGRPTFVTHLECAATGEHHAADQVHNLSAAGKPLLVRYDLGAVGKALNKDALAGRPADLWRYRELLPVRRTARHRQPGRGYDAARCVAEAHRQPRRRRAPGEGRGPVADRHVQGARPCHGGIDGEGAWHPALAMPTNGNAGAALAAYASRAGIRTTMFCPEDTPEVNVREIALQGARVYRVDGLIDDCGKIVAEGRAKVGWFDVSTLKEPYRIEGKKTMGFELAEQLGWQLPDVILYPTGGGTGLIGMWKAFAELEAIGFIGAQAPAHGGGAGGRLRAHGAGIRGRRASMRRAGRMRTRSRAGMRVPQAIGDFLILRAVRESGGFAIAVADDAITAALDEVAGTEGFLMCPETAATYAALKQSLADGRIGRHEQVVLFNCASGLKYPLPPVDRTLDRTKPIDFAAL